MKESPTQLFLSACGLPSPWILRCQDATGEDDLESRLRLALPFAMVGREVRPGLRLDDESVSRRHAFLQMADGGLRVYDLQSRRGIAWEDEDAGKSGRLEAGRGVLIGPYRLSWRAEGVGVDRPPPADEPMPTAALVLPFRVGGRDAVWRLEEEIALAGRSNSCGLVLADESVSRFHAAFVRTPKGVWVVDLQAREGVTVAGVRVRWAWLADGDVVRIGRFALGFRYLANPPSIDRDDTPLDAGALDVGRLESGRKAVAGPVRRTPSRSLQRRDESPPSSSEIVEATPGPQPPAVLGPDGPAMDLWKRQVETMESFHNDMVLMARMFFAMHQDQLTSVRDEMSRLETLTAELESLKGRLEQNEAEQAGAKTRPTTAGGRPKTPERKAAPREEPEPTAEDDPVLLHGALAHRIASLQQERRTCWQRILGRIQAT